MRTLPLLVLAACSSSAPVTIGAADVIGGPEIVHTLTPAEGLAVRGALTELGGRLYGLAGERGPSGSPDCSSGAAWNTIEHRAHCPGALFSVALAPGADGTHDFRVEHTFGRLDDATLTNADGYHPYGTLAATPDELRPGIGRLCGVTQTGGAHGYGVAFCYDPASGTLEVIHHFGSELGGADGLYPMGAVAVGPDGTVYGTAKSGVLWAWSASAGFRHVPLPGEVYGGVTLAAGRLHGASWTGDAEHGGGWYFTADATTLTVEATPLQPTPWPAHGADNAPIQAPLVLRGGTVVLPREWAGPAGAGALLVPFGTLWAADDISLDTTPRFANTTGAMPNGQLAEGPGGAVYFSAQYGGAYGTGAIARVYPDGRFELLWSWPDGAYPYGGVALASDGALWGVTFDTSEIWRLPLTR